MWLRLFRRDILESSLELVTIETMKRDAPQGRLDQERKLANIFNSVRIHGQDETVLMEIPVGTYKHLRLCSICSKPIPEGFVARAGCECLEDMGYGEKA